MKNKFIIAGISLMFILLAVQSKAQEQETVPVPRWEVGVDFLSLVGKNQYPMFSVFGLKEVGERGWAFRGRIGGNFNLRSNPFQVPFTDFYLIHDVTREIDLFLLLGFQKSLVRNTKSDMYFGSDIAYMKNKITTENVISGPDNDIYFDDLKTTTKRLSLAPFIGYSKTFGQKITLRYEMAFILGREIFEENGKGYLINDSFGNQQMARDNFGTPSYTSFNKVRFDFLSLNPFYQLLLTYKL